MTEDQSYMPIRNERKNSCDYAGQSVAFDLEKYDPYLDKIRALFVPSLEYRVHSLLEEFVYSTDSLWAKRFPCFKKFVNAMVMWKDLLNKLAEYNIDMMEEMIKNTVKCVVKDNLVTCFLDSIILHHRLNKICRELDALGIEDNILRNLNIWNFVNEKNYLDCTCFAYETHTSVDCNTNSNVAEEPARCKKAVKSLAANEVYRNGSTEHMRPTTSEYRAMEHQQILDSNKNFLQQKEDNSNVNNSTCSATGLQNDCTDKAHKSFNEKSCDTVSNKIWSTSKLKTIVHKMYLEDCGCVILSKSVVTYLFLPCNPSNLIRQIFKTDPSLSESCLIVIKRKFEASMYNVCSCLNDVLGKIDVKFVKALHLDCEIRPGYICFKLKIDKAGNVNKCLFVARVPICQNVHKRTVQQYSAVSSSKISTEVEESKCSKQCKDSHNNFNDTLMHIDEESKNLSDSNLSSRSDRSLVKDMATNISQGKTENNDEEESTCITEKISYCNKSCENIVKGICNITSCNDNLNQENKEYCKILNSIEIDCNKDAEKHRNDILVSCNAINNDKSSQLENDANCMCLPSFNKMNNGIENIFSDKEMDSFSQITDVNKHDCICSSDKESNLENENYNINTCSITSFVQNPEHDKQLVELNYNRCSDNNIRAIDRQLDSEDDNSLNSAKVEIGCDSSCSCRHNDFIDITVIDNISEENIICTFEESRNDFDAVKTRNTNYPKRRTSSKNNSLTVSVQTPKLKVSSKSDNVDISCPRTILCLASGNDKNISTIVKTRDEYNETTDPFVRALIIPKEGNRIFRDIDMEVFNMRDKTRGFIKSSERSLVSKEELGSNEDLRSFSISTEEYLCAENHSVCVTSNTSQYCHSFATTNKFRTSDRRDEIQKSYKSSKLSKLRRRRRASSSNGIRSVTSFTTIKYRNTPCSQNNDYVKDAQPQTILVMTKLRNSVDRSVDRIKRMIRAKLKRVLFNNKAKTMSTTKTLCENEESSEDTTRRKTSGSCIRQGYSITSCSTSDCCRRGYTISSCESSNVILSISRNRGRARDEGGMKLHDHRLVGGSEALSSFRSIKAFPWSYDLLTPTPENLKEGKFSKNSRSRYNRKEKTEDKRDIIKYNKNSRQCNSRNYGTNITISSQSAKVSLIENEYFECRKCKQRKETRDNKHVCKQEHSQDRQRSEEVQHKCRRSGKKKKYQEVPAKYTGDTSDKSSEMSSSFTWTRETKNVHKQFHSVSEPKKVKRKFALLGKNRQLFEKDLHKRRAFEMLIDTYNDYVDDLDLDFKLKLLRYVELCKSVKRLLIRTLQPDDVNEINMASMHASDL